MATENEQILDGLLRQMEQEGRELRLLRNAIPREYVYVIAADAVSAVKIGIARDPAQRLRTLQAGNSADLRLAFTIPTYRAPELERRLHELYAPFRLRGEWFKDTVLADMRAAIDQLRREDLHVAIP